MNQRFDKIAPTPAAKLNMTFDVVLGVGIMTVGYAAVHGPVALLQNDYPALLGVFLFGWSFIAAVLRLYSPCTARSPLDSLILGAIGTASITFALALVDRMFHAGQPVSFNPGLFFFSFLATGSVFRLLFVRLQRVEGPQDDVLIVGTGPLAVATYERMRAITGERRRVIGLLYFDGQRKETRLGPPVLGPASNLEKLLLEHPVAEVYVAGRVLTHGEQMQKLVSVCEKLGVPFALPLHSLHLERATLLSSSKATDGYLHYLSTNQRPVGFALKRLFDIAASTAALVVLAPLLALTALIIKLTSRGPVLFKQSRVGLHGARFHLLKFRSMVENAEALKKNLAADNEQSGPVFKMRNDPRITPIGRFIRKFSIDELPQLVNILRGDMSIVGPRPALPKEVAQYKVWQRRRLSVRPGLTCYWQVGGRNEIGFEEWMRLDLQYVDHWSLGVDLQLILRTVPIVITGRGAS